MLPQPEDDSLSFAAWLQDCRSRVKPGKLLVDGPDRLTYGSLFDRIGRLGGYLRANGLDSRARAVIISASDTQVIEIFFGLISQGVTAVVLNPQATPTELESLLGAADPSIIFADEALCSMLPVDRWGDPICTIVPIAAEVKPWPIKRLFSREDPKESSTYPGILATAKPAACATVPDSTTAFILFTSGTTSRPKGVEITHANLFAQMQSFIDNYGFDDATRLLNLLPFHHTDGLTQGAVVSFCCGGTLLRPMRFRVDRLPALLDEVYKSRVTHFVSVPSMLALIRQLGDDYVDSFKTPDFRFIISTAAYLDAALWSALQERLGVQIVNVYGLTETVCEACYCGPQADRFRMGSVGKARDCEVRTVDDEGRDTAAGEPGELLIRGPNVMKGYFRMPEETAAVLVDGWFHTGDVATIDEDGFVFIVGRKKSLIISGGYNIYPEDVTHVLMGMTGIVDAVTLGVPDTIWGERVVSCVVVDPQADIAESDISAYFLQHASPEKLPRDIHILEEFPRGPAGKVVLSELRVLLEQRGRDVEEASAGEVDCRVIKIAAHVFKLPADELQADSSPDTTSNWSSLAHVEFLMTIETEFNVTFSPRDIMSIVSLGDAVEVLGRKLS